MKHRWNISIASLFLFCLSYGIFLAWLFPQELAKLPIVRPYIILTDSMEPVLPVSSLIFVRQLQDESPMPGDILTFYALRNGQRMLFSHYYDHRELQKDGSSVIITHAYGKQADPYEITGDDVVGIVMFHIPYVGKVILFLQSIHGRIAIIIDLSVMCIFKLITRKSD